MSGKRGCLPPPGAGDALLGGAASAELAFPACLPFLPGFACLFDESWAPSEQSSRLCHPIFYACVVGGGGRQEM